MKSKNGVSHQTLPSFLLGLAMLFYAAGFSYLTVNRYAAFEARALDLGNLHQTVWNTAHGRPFQMTNQPGTINRLSLHVEPILLPIAALYWIHDGPATLLILQAIVVALGAWPLYALAWQRLRSGWLALPLALVYLLNPTIQAANWLEFHPVTLAPTFLLATFYCLVTKRNRWFVCFALLAASCKEEIGLLLFMLGGYALLVLRRPRIGLLTMGLSLSWSLIAVLGIQQFFADGNIHWGRYDYLGVSPLDKVMTLATNPQLVWQQLQAAAAFGYLYQLLWPVGFVALLAPEVLLLALPSLAINLLADFPPMHEVYTLIYAAPIVPFVMLAMVEGVKKVASIDRQKRFVPSALRELWYKTFLGNYRRWQAVSGAENRGNRGIRHYGVMMVLLLSMGSALLAQRQHGYLPGGGNYRHYTVTDHDRRAAMVMAQIPPTAKVSAQDKLDPHVAGRETIYIFPRIDDADTIFVDVTGPAWPQHPNDLYTDVQRLLAGDWGVAAGDDGYLLLRKAVANKRIPDEFYSAFRAPLPTGHATVSTATHFGEQLTLLGHHVLVDEQGETVVQLLWQRIGHPLPTDYRIYVAFADRAGNVLHDTLFYPPVATLWYPTSMWRSDEQVLVQTLPWQLAVDQFTLLVGVYAGEDGWQAGRRLSIGTDATPQQIHLENNSVTRLGSYQWARDGWMGDGWQPISLPQALAEPLNRVAVTFADGPVQIALTGVALGNVPTASGEELQFSLAWQAGGRPIQRDYSVFAHLLNAQGEKITQLDWQPRDDWGPRPMTTWFAAMGLVDRQSLSLPAYLPPGNYRLILGVYNWQTGNRLTATGEDAAPGDVVTIAQFSIK